MPKKREVYAYLLYAFIIGLLFLPIGIASGEVNDSTSTANPNEGSRVNNATLCLSGLVQDKTAAELGFGDAVFGTLALGSRQNFIERIDSEKSSTEACWPKGGCKLKDTSQVLLAYRQTGKSSDDVRDWISKKNLSISGIDWFLQIDIENAEASKCSVSYDTQSASINIGDDGKVSGTLGNCFDLSSDGIWLKVRKTCQSKTFTVSCDKTFTTSVLYQKTGSGMIFVSEDSITASAGTTTEESIKGKCLGTTTACDYEGTLWAAMVLQRIGVDVSDYLPYLTAFAEDNARVFPASFLHILTGGENYYSDIVQSMSQNKYWLIAGTPYNKFYDTSMGMLSLSGTNAQELDSAKAYLLGIQDRSGCWNNNNIKDTAFILYSGWMSSGFGAGGTGGTATPGSTIVGCSEGGFDCSTSADCTNSGGNILYDYDCSEAGYGMVCCDETVQLPLCSELGGIICNLNQDCQGSSESSIEGSCCTGGACLDSVTASECELNEGTCDSSCNSDEQQGSFDCNSASDLCCVEKTGGSSLWIWIIIIAILIILIVVAIIYREKIIIWWHKRKSRSTSTSITRAGTPSSSGFGGFARPFGFGAPSRPQPRAPARAPSRQPSKKESELDEVLRKLKEIGK